MIRWALVFTLISSSVSPAIADDRVTPEALAEAKELYGKANDHYNLGEFAPALEQYKAAYRISKIAAFLFNIAQCHRRLGQYQDAIVTYRSYLSGVPNAENKQLVLELITESEKLLEEQRAEADRKTVEDAQRLREELEANARAAEAARKAKEAEALIEQKRAEQARLDAERYDRHPARTWAIVGGGVGIASVITGGLFGLAARGRQTAFDNAGCGDPAQPLDQSQLATCRDDRDRGQRNAVLSNAFLIGGAAITLASAIVFVLDPGNVSRPQTTIAISPASFDLVVRW